MSDYYTAGVCNINSPEVEYRRKFGRIFAIISFVSAVMLIIVSAAPIVSVLLTLPVFISAISYLQSKNRFCVAYAAQGKFNSSEEYADTATVENEYDLVKDKSKAQLMYRQAGLISVVLTVVFYVLLSLIN